MRYDIYIYICVIRQLKVNNVNYFTFDTGSLRIFQPQRRAFYKLLSTWLKIFDHYFGTWKPESCFNVNTSTAVSIYCNICMKRCQLLKIKNLIES